MTQHTSDLYRANARSALPCYSSPLGEWNSRGWVRARAPLPTPFEGDHHFYSRSSSGLFHHEAVVRASSDQQRRLLAYVAVRSFDLTIFAEDKIVSPTASALAHGKLLPVDCAASRQDGYRLAIDEAWHSLATFDLRNRVCEAARIDPPNGTGDADRAFQKLFDRNDAGLHPLVLFGLSTAIETIISGDLSSASNDDEVYPSVSAVLRDHGRDEARHNALFRGLFAASWPVMTAGARTVYADSIARGIKGYLELDRAWLQVVLDDCRITRDSSAVAYEVMTAPEYRKRIDKAATSTLQMLRRAGVLDCASTAAGFVAEGLIR